jgi:nucleotide-binding universal stress UspA family protein
MTTAVKAPELVQLKNLLYATDFSEPSESALPFALALARRYDATIHALHILTPNSFASGSFALAGVAFEAETEAALASMRELESRLAGVQHKVVLERAVDVWAGVEQAIRDCTVDLIVLGTHGRTGAQRFLLGSVAEEIFRHSPVPVLTVGPAVRTSAHHGGRFHRILFATDHTPASLAAAPYAVSLAENNQARLVLLHVAPPIEPGKIDRNSELSVAEMIQRLYETVPSQAQLSIPPEVAIEYGRPAQKIIEAAAERSADLIVLGVRTAHGHLPSATHVERATAHEVVAHASCPVLTVRERDGGCR